MTIKVQVTNVINKLFDNEKKKRDVLVSKSAVIAKATKLLSSVMKTGNPDEGEAEEAISSLSRTQKSIRTKLKGAKSIEKFKRAVTVTSDKTWLFVDEFECPDSGRTLYGNSDQYETVDEVPVRFNGKLNKLKLNETFDFKSGVPVKQQVAEAKARAIEVIREKRKARKEVPHTVKELVIPGLPYRATYKLYAGGGCGGENAPRSKYFIHMEKGEILKLKEATKLRRIFEAKVPKNNLNHVGIEIEFISKIDKFELATILAKNGVSEYVELKDDGSLRPEKENGFPFGHELCVLAPEVAIHEVLRLVMKSLDEAGSKVNNRCGLHVHIDMRNRDRKVVFHNFVNSQNVLYAMNPRSRLDGTKADGKKDTAFSKKVTYSDFDEAVEQLRNGDKYWGINPLTYTRLKTIEIRLHSGSTNFVKVSNWIKILTNIANTATKYKKDVDTAEEFCDRLHLNDELLAYIKERMSKFKDKSGKHVTVDEVA